MLAANHGDRDNLHFLSELVPSVIRTACYLPLWTAVMVPHFKSVNITTCSESVEAKLKNIKHGLFKHECLPIKIYHFVIRHLEFMERKRRLSSLPIRKTDYSEEKSEKNNKTNNNCEAPCTLE